jgi:hypothetical protein
LIALIRECSFDAQEAINAVRYESAIKKRFPGRSSCRTFTTQTADSEICEMLDRLGLDASMFAQRHIPARAQANYKIKQYQSVVLAVCTENLNPDVMVMQAAQERV